MKIDAVNAFGALAHDLRLSVFRLLIQAGPEGLPAGRIALRLEVPASTLSTHLARLEAAGLLQARRERQRIHYSVELDGTRSLVRYLLEDCCNGNPLLCGYNVAGDNSPTDNKAAG